jgi:hypothetical protein|eukprot:SAG25_NODE_1580_length_2738_cov_1.670330_4_plen_347_part_00
MREFWGVVEDNRAYSLRRNSNPPTPLNHCLRRPLSSPPAPAGLLSWGAHACACMRACVVTYLSALGNDAHRDGEWLPLGTLLPRSALAGRRRRRLRVRGGRDGQAMNYLVDRAIATQDEYLPRCTHMTPVSERGVRNYGHPVMRGARWDTRRTASRPLKSAEPSSSIADCLSSVCCTSTLRQPIAANIGRTISSQCACEAPCPEVGLTKTSTRVPLRGRDACRRTALTQSSAPSPLPVWRLWQTQLWAACVSSAVGQPLSSKHSSCTPTVCTVAAWHDSPNATPPARAFVPRHSRGGSHRQVVRALVRAVWRWRACRHTGAPARSSIVGQWSGALRTADTARCCTG